MAAACTMAAKRATAMMFNLTMAKDVDEDSTGRLMTLKVIHPRFYIFSLLSCESEKPGVGHALRPTQHPTQYLLFVALPLPSGFPP